MRVIVIVLLTSISMSILSCGASNNRQSRRESKDAYWRDEATRVSMKRAVFELNCPQEKISIHELTLQKVMGSYFFQFGVEGCGNREIYHTSCVSGACTAVNERLQQQNGQPLPPAGINSGNPPGTPPGSPPGTLPGAPLGSPPGTLPGTPPGSTPGTLP
jgi:hypothetical protein